MCSRKWEMPFVSFVSKRDPIRTQSETWPRWRWGWGTTRRLSPLGSCVSTSNSKSFVVEIFRGCAAVRLRVVLLHVFVVDLDVGLRGIFQAPDVDGERFGLLGGEESLHVRLALLVEVFL